MASVWFRLLFWISLITFVFGQDAPSSGADECASQPIEDYNMPMRIGSLFIILITSALGVFSPMILHHISPYDHGGVRDWILTVGKFFGTGVILATAFVHMLPDAMENFSSKCLTAGWLSYGAFAGVFCMLASFALQLLELVAFSRMQTIRKAKKQNNGGEESAKPTLENHTDDATYIGHVHSAGFLEDEEEAFKHIGTFILELGIMMHSVIIGITLSVTDNDEFKTLLIALVFHQFFEGIALGTRINELNYKSWGKPVVMGLVYIVTTPVGVAIGIGIHSSFNPNSYSSVLSQAILDSLSAGILLYNAYVSLMSMEISHSARFHGSALSRKIVCFLSMYIGAGLMSLIGEWA
ncbi:hypothetical protein DFQ28_006360 [Apophysomyces sp. BC1034]|nr:hypothetical protein DFQ30_006124 [Apophysomyces sp. BC1015]KAG0176459.1 hypothetical protein DFQ29_006086 [Apophysomyces sp. BC1021]KAG0193137.1 hypothetical protein DFQ28_006360 [Apophysomyces sp. BC1034]